MSVPRILVTDAQDRPALAAIRCLRAGGYRVSATASVRLAPGLWSRDCSQAAVLPEPAANVDAFVEGLESILAADRHDILVPGTDETLYAVSLRRDRIEPHVTLGLPEHAAVERAFDKTCLATEAQRVGLSAPEARVCDRLEDALAAAATFGFPLLVKGVRAIAYTAPGLIRYPTRLVSDEPALRAAKREFGTCIVQRREPGNLMSCAGVATGQGLLGTVVSRYRRTWPPQAGQASFLETVSPADDLVERVDALVRAIGWQGLFQLQMIEGEDGGLKVIDFNPRLFGSMSIARAAGVPITTLWCAWLLGRNPAPVAARPGIRYRMEDMDARHILWQVRRHDYRGAILAAMPRRHTTHAYFRLRDPLPLVLRGAELIGVRLRRRGAGGPR